MRSETQDQTQALDVLLSLPVFYDGLSGSDGRREPTSQVKRSQPTDAGSTVTQHEWTSPTFYVEAQHYLNYLMI